MQSVIYIEKKRGKEQSASRQACFVDTRPSEDVHIKTCEINKMKQYMNETGNSQVKRESFASRSLSLTTEQRLWNDIPNEMKQCVDVESFKKTLKTFLFNKF